MTWDEESLRHLNTLKWTAIITSLIMWVAIFIILYFKSFEHYIVAILVGMGASLFQYYFYRACKVDYSKENLDRRYKKFLKNQLAEDLINNKEISFEEFQQKIKEIRDNK